MNESIDPNPRTFRLPVWIAAAGSAVVLVVMACSAYWQLFTTFRFWDDEGYVLISLRNFAAGGKLYSEVFSQYGPFYNLCFAFLHRFLGVPLDTAGARWIVLAAWVASTLLAAGLVRRLTGSWWWALAAGAATFVQLRLLTAEPLHPVDLVALLLMVGTTAALLLLVAGRRGPAFATAAAAGVALALVKINVGLFYLAGLAVFALWSTRGLAARPWARIVLALLAAAAGAVLMRPLLADAWVRTFLVVYVAASTMTLATLSLEIQADEKYSDGLRQLLMATFATGGAIIAVSLASDIGPSQLWEGIIRGPLLQPVNFFYAFRWSGLTLPVLSLNGAAFLLHLFLRSHAPVWAARLVAACRLVVGAGFLFSFFHGFAVSVEGYLLSFGTGFIWALAARLGPPAPARDRARQLLAALTIFQVLHAFPVAGTQVNLGTLPLVLLLLLGLHEVALWSAAQGWRRAALALAAAAVVFPMWRCVRLTIESGRAYFSQAPETFSGAQLHLSPWQSSTFATLVANARWHGDMLYSLPGMFSFNAWSGLPTPNMFNSTQWWSFLSESRQASIAAQLDRDSRPLIIVQRNLITSDFAKAVYHPTLLTHFIEERFVKIFELDSYEFWGPRDREIYPLGIAKWDSESAATTFSFYTPASNSATATRAAFENFQERDQTTVPPPARFALVHTPMPGTGLAKWVCTCSLADGFRRADCDIVRFFDNTGHLIMEARFERPKPQANPQ